LLFDELTAGGFDELTAGGFDELTAGGFDELTAGRLRAGAQDIQSAFCTIKGVL
jgi:hypothetical protein